MYHKGCLLVIPGNLYVLLPVERDIVSAWFCNGLEQRCLAGLPCTGCQDDIEIIIKGWFQIIAGLI